MNGGIINSNTRLHLVGYFYWSWNICVNLGKQTNSLEASRSFRTKGKWLNTDSFKKPLLAYPFLEYNSAVVKV